LKKYQIPGQFGLKLQEIKIQEPKWIDCDIIRGLIDFSRVILKKLKVEESIKN